MTNTFLHAQRELEILSSTHTDPADRPIIEPFKDEILALCEAFGSSGQSGGSAPYAVQVICKALADLLLQNPICPITGEAWEWADITERNEGVPMFQNKRCSAIFKDADDRAYYLDAVVFKGQDNGAFTTNAVISGVTSRLYIKSFPFTPKTFYVDVVETKDGYIVVKPNKVLSRIKEYYDVE